MRADTTKQRLKNAVYRGLGEATAAVPTRAREPDLRVLMYHKVNDRRGNSATVPTALFAEQMAMLRELGYTVVGLDAVLDLYLRGRPLPPRAVLITFDDGYRDNLENALPALLSAGYPAVLFAAVGYVGETRPLPHDERLARRGIANPTLSWTELRELDRAGVRVESHGISHTPLVQLGLEAAAHELSASKLRLEDELGRPVRAFAYPKGSAAHFRPVHLDVLRRAGYDVAFTTISGANTTSSDPLRLRRYNVEPYPARTFELVLAGACDLIAIKDTVAGTRVRRVFNAALGTSSR